MASGQPITKLNISTTKDEEEILRAQGYQLININLNEGTGGQQVYLWYKKESGNTPVTRIEFSFTPQMKYGLADAGYTLVNRDLNAGVGGDHIFLWYFYGSTKYDIPIVDLAVTVVPTEEPALMKDGWERLGCDLNRNTRGNLIYLWVKREKTSYIQDVAATVDYTPDKQMFELGYTRVGEDTNRGADGPNLVFLWYRRTTDKKQALTGIDVSTTLQEEEKLQKEGYKVISVDLNKGTGGKVVFLWCKKGGDQSIQAMAQLITRDSWSEYQKAGLNFIEKNLNEGNKGWKMYITYK